MFKIKQTKIRQINVLSDLLYWHEKPIRYLFSIKTDFIFFQITFKENKKSKHVSIFLYLRKVLNMDNYKIVSERFEQNIHRFDTLVNTLREILK